jgi:hypothetical protein
LIVEDSLSAERRNVQVRTFVTPQVSRRWEWHHRESSAGRLFKTRRRSSLLGWSWTSSGTPARPK